MPKIMLVNMTHSEESRVAILDDSTLEAFEIESLGRKYRKGNLYKGIIRRIHPALEAAFVDIGAGRDAFLPLDEICFRNLPLSLGKPEDSERPPNGHHRIREILRSGQHILVQIAKEQFANKPPTLTTFYSLAGRHLVLLPGSDDSGISRRIEGDERLRIRKMLREVELPDGYGVIVRTAAGFDDRSGELQRDLRYLQRLWENIRRTAQKTQAPLVVYREHDIVLRTIRDFLTPEIDEIHIDNDEVCNRARTFLEEISPGQGHILHCYRGAQPIFSAFNIEQQIESIFKRQVQLHSGGSIVIDGTEALTAIDVNSGGSVRGSNPEQTAFRTNLEAAHEIPRQLRLRDIGGLIVVDFIDMRDSEHVRQIEQAVREAMQPDKARHDVGRISHFGLMDLSRQRLRPAATSTTYISCPMCEGHGAVRTTESAALVALRKLHNRVSAGNAAAAALTLPAPVAVYLLNQKRSDLAALEQRYGTRIQVNTSTSLMPHEMELDVQDRTPESHVEALEQQPNANGIPAPGTQSVTVAAPLTQAAGAPAGARKRRRRRGGRGRKRRVAAANGEAAAGNGTQPSAPVIAATAAAEQGGMTALAPEGKPEPTSPPAAADKPTDRTSSDAKAAPQKNAGPRRRRGRRAKPATEQAAADAHKEMKDGRPKTKVDEGAPATSAPDAGEPAAARTSAQTRAAKPPAKKATTKREQQPAKKRESARRPRGKKGAAAAKKTKSGTTTRKKEAAAGRRTKSDSGTDESHTKDDASASEAKPNARVRKSRASAPRRKRASAASKD